MKSNIIDAPRLGSQNDLLGIDKYTEALKLFIENAMMPTTTARWWKA